MFTSAYKLLVPPDGEPVAYADCVPQLRVVDPNDQAYVTALITKARREVERRLERQLMTATWRVTYDAFPNEIQLGKPPIQSVLQIQYIDMSGNLEILDPSWYQVSIRGEDTPARIMPAYAHFWPFTRAQTYDTVMVDFVAGYGDDPVDVPATIQHAILFLVAHWFENRLPLESEARQQVPETLDAIIGQESWGAYS
jgi:uncharacterized phiE125 gp8 family phage protein